MTKEEENPYFKDEKWLQIPDLPSYDISDYGRLRKVTINRYVIIPRNKKNLAQVYKDGKQKKINVLHVMLTAFKTEYSPSYIVQYKDKNKKNIELSNILFIRPPKTKRQLFFEGDSEHIAYYKCQEKAQTQNDRCSNGELSKYDVLNALKLSNFTCFYCGDKLSAHWHLDHFVSIFNGGSNTASNIVASCATCNLMKHSLNGKDFFNSVTKIYHNNRTNDYIEGSHCLTLERKTIISNNNALVNENKVLSEKVKTYEDSISKIEALKKINTFVELIKEILKDSDDKNFVLYISEKGYRLKKGIVKSLEEIKTVRRYAKLSSCILKNFNI